jgi:hypothetical protein
MLSNRTVICCKTRSHLQHTACYFSAVFPHIAAIYVSGKEMKMLLFLKLANHFDYVTLSNLIATLKKSPCTYVYQYPILRHGLSKIKYKLVLVCGQNITHYFYSSFLVLHIYLYLINLHLIIDYTHFYYYIPFWIFYFAESLNSRWDLSGASFPFQYLNSSHMGVYQSSGLSG